MALDRVAIARQLYGRFGEPTANLLTTPAPLASPNTRLELDLDRANRLLDEAGYRRAGDGIRRTPDGGRRSEWEVGADGRLTPFQRDVPAGFDPRRRPWYELATANRGWPGPSRLSSHPAGLGAPRP